jgi:Flp pilus assembly pilin Flp
MKRLKHLLKAFIQDERGQTTTEYILIVAVVAMIALKMGETLRDSVLQLFETNIEKARSEIENF